MSGREAARAATRPGGHHVDVASFDWDGFVERCLATEGEGDRLGAIAEVVGEAIADPARLQGAVQLPMEPDDDGVVHRSADLLVVNVLFPRGFRTGIHDHRIPAVIGAWAGFEDNLLFERRAEGIARRASRRIRPGEVLALDADAIHDVHAPSATWCGAVHVYLGDLAAVDRSAWAAEDAPETACDGGEMERRWAALATATGLTRRPAQGADD